MNTFHGDALVEKAESVASRAEFAAFLSDLVNNYRNHPEEWENVALDEFLAAMQRFVENMDGYYRNTGAKVDANVPEWHLFAEMLLAGRVYE